MRDSRDDAPPPESGERRTSNPVWARNAGYLLGAQIFRNLAPLLILLTLARLTDPETVGRYSLVLAIVTPFFVFAQLGLRTVSLTLAPEGRFVDYLSLQSLALIAAFIAACAFGAITHVELLIAVMLASFVKAADAYSDFLSGPLQRHGKARIVFTSSLISALGVSAATAVTVALTRDLIPTLLVLATTSLVCAYAFLFRPSHRTARAAEAKFVTPRGSHTREIRRIFGAGLPLGISLALMSLIATVPQYILTTTHGETATAQFAVVLYVYALADIVTATVSQAWIPLAQGRAERSNSSNPVARIAVRGSLQLTALYVPGTIIGMLIASVGIPLLFGSAYAFTFEQAIPLTLAIIALPWAHVLSIALAIQNRYVHSISVAGGSAALSLLMCVILVPTYGIAGAFWALFASVLSRAAIAGGILFTRGARTHSQ